MRIPMAVAGRASQWWLALSDNFCSPDSARSFFRFYFLRPPSVPSAPSDPTMPKAFSDRFSRGHEPSFKSAAKKSGKKQTSESSEPSSSGTRNPIFNTERFGQHILKNPLVAQG